LVAGPLSPEVEALARRTAEERHARYVPVRDLSPAVELASPAPYQRRNFAVALAAAEAMLGSLDSDRVADVAAHLELHGRVEVIEGDPEVVLDAAHNPDGARALAEALPGIAAGRPVIACMAVLADKDVGGILAALGPSLAAVVATEIPAEVLARAGRPGAQALAAGDLGAVARRSGVGHVEEAVDPAGAVSRGRELAHLQGGVALVCGSHYLLRYASG
jgi:dihydrofolate synthase/folylpolyglutamate synthase